MGEAQRNRKAFLAEHGVCVFCGGGVSATTVEHCPPRILFENKQWPEGFQFPSCGACNHDTSDADLLVAVLCRSGLHHQNLDGKVDGLLKLANRQFPNLIEKMIPSAVEARRMNKELGIRPVPGALHQDSPVMKLPPEFSRAVETFACKLSKAAYYKFTGKVFPSSGCLLLWWYTNVDLLKDEKFSLLKNIQEVIGIAEPVVRSGKPLGDQFSYKMSWSEQPEAMLFQAIFGASFGLVTFGSSVEGLLESKVLRLRSEAGKGGLTVLQSPSIQPGFVSAE